MAKASTRIVYARQSISRKGRFVGNMGEQTEDRTTPHWQTAIKYPYLPQKEDVYNSWWNPPGSSKHWMPIGYIIPLDDDDE